MREALLFCYHVCDIRLYVIDDVKFFQWDDPNDVILCSHTESIKEKERVIMQDGNAKLVVHNMRLVNKCNNHEQKWLVQLGEGKANDPSFDWKAIKPPDVELCPQHGIAILVDNKICNGKPFCFLPLPEFTNLPVHIHGQFVLHSNDRMFWMPNTSNIYTDMKSVWNRHLIDAISISYANLLTHAISHDCSPCDKEKLLISIQEYYKLYPSISEIALEPWKTLAESVYKQLSILNPPILTTIVKSNIIGNTSYMVVGEEKQLYVTKWCRLHLPQQSDEGYFHSFHFYQSNVYNALKDIGMNLLDTPHVIYRQFKQVGIDLPNISKESVLAYYIRFHDIIFNFQTLPCHVSSTRFGNAKCFMTFVVYLSLQTNTAVNADNKDVSTSITQRCISAQDLQAIGCLMTINEHVHCLSDNKKIIASTSWMLFPNSDYIFMHEDWINYTGSNSIFQPKESGICYDLIHSVFTENLPLSWCEAAHAPLGDVKIS